MEVLIESRAEEFLEKYDYRDFLRIIVNGDKVLSVSDGEPEDSNISRNFSEVNNIDTLMEMAHQAGENGENLEFMYKQSEY